MKPRKTMSTARMVSPVLLSLLIAGCGARRTADPLPATPLPGGPAERAPISQEAAASETEWLAIFINGQKSGHLKSTRTVTGDRVTTEVTTLMVMARGETLNEIRTVSTMTETTAGAPLEIEKRISGAGMDQTVTGRLLPNGRLRLITESAGQRDSREIEWPKGALMNEGQRLETLRHGLAKGTAYTSTYFDPDLLEAIPVKVEVGGKTEVDLLGRVATGTHVKLTMTMRGTQLPLDMYVDDAMNTLKTATSRMGMTVEMVACTEQVATSRDEPAEVIRSTFIPSPVRLSTAERSRPLTYTLRRLSGAAPLRLISTDEQTATARDGEVALRVARRLPEQGFALPYAGEDEAARAALVRSAWIQSDAKPIVALAKAARRGATNSVQAAANIQAFVADYIQEKDFSVGYASALEVARSRKGDCTEHALLTAALCRASGIPAEVVVGLLYVAQFEDQRDLFGGHAWTRVYLDGRWHSLDAAMGGFGTGHIALAVSRDGNPADFFQILDIIGDLQITAVR